jgi:hypothetical protein
MNSVSPAHDPNPNSSAHNDEEGNQEKHTVASELEIQWRMEKQTNV